MSDGPKLVRTAKGTRPAYADDPAVDQLIATVVALAGEVAVLRDRLDTCEALAGRGVPFTAADVDAYVPDDEERARREARRAAYIERVFRPLIDDAGGGADGTEDAADIIARFRRGEL